MDSDDYQYEQWYINLTVEEKDLLNDLKQIQEKIGKDKRIEKQQNPIKSELIEQRIEKLLPDENFYFFKIFTGSSETSKLRNAIEKKELIRLIENHFMFEKLYLKDGQLEPIQLLEEERDMVIEGMQT